VFGCAEGAYVETRHVAAVLTGPDIDFFTAKGIVENIAAALHLTRLEFGADIRPQMHPARCATISLAGQSIGYVAEVDPDLIKSSLDVAAGVGRVAVFELDADALLTALDQVTRYAPLPRFPAISRDIAALVDSSVPYARLESAAREAVDSTLTEGIGLQSVYTGERVPAGKKSVALRLTFRAADRTLTDAEVDTQMAAVEALLADRVGAEKR
jgi:phenylalanyl-tRNA synthetase beta chain